MLKNNLNQLKNQTNVGKLVKTIVGLCVGFGADIAVSSLLNVHLPRGRFMRALGRLGVFVLGYKAGEEAEEYFVKVVDETADAIKEAKEESLTDGAEVP